MLRFTIPFLAFTFFGCGMDPNLQYESGSQEQAFEGNARYSSIAQGRAETIAASLRRVGVCELPVLSGVAGLKISSSDDVLAQFVCIANNESVLGKKVHGIGGAGAFGTNLGHLDRGVRVTYRGRTYACRPGLIHNMDLNAECAFALYLNRRGFGDWGKAYRGFSWGSNRHCHTEYDLAPWRKFRCGPTPCEKPTLQLGEDRKLLVSVKSACAASKAVVELFQLEGKRTVSVLEKEFPWTSTGAQNSVTIDLAAIALENHTHVRVKLMRNDEEFYRTNPSLSLPAPQTPEEETEADSQGVEETEVPDPSSEASPEESQTQPAGNSSEKPLAERCKEAFPGDENRDQRIDCLLGKVSP